MTSSAGWMIVVARLQRGNQRTQCHGVDPPSALGSEVIAQHGAEQCEFRHLPTLAECLDGSHGYANPES